MSSGLLALLDDVAVLAKVAAASLDDVALQAAKVGVKAAGMVIDDTAVAPAYVTAFPASRELPIVARIAAGSLRNKLLFLLPGALLLEYFAPWAIVPVLMLGSLYLCFEGAEKIAHAIWPPPSHDEAPLTEDARVRGAIKTDLILSAEIMAITLGNVTELAPWRQASVLAAVALALTVLVYGAVALIVKVDDAGLVLATRGPGPLRGLGRSMVQGVPALLRVLGALGTAAMLWLGGGIVLHGLETFGWAAPAHALHRAAEAAGPAAWFVSTAGSGLLGLALGAVLVAGRNLAKPA